MGTGNNEFDLMMKLLANAERIAAKNKIPFIAAVGDDAAEECKIFITGQRFRLKEMWPVVVREFSKWAEGKK